MKPVIHLAPAHLNIILPEGVTYDEVQVFGEGRVKLHCFTDTTCGAVGASFSIPETLLGSVEIARQVARVRAEHRAPSCPLPPLFQCYPRTFDAPETHHY